jgi:glutaminase
LTKQLVLVWSVALSLAFTSCTTLRAAFSGGAADAPAVALTPAPADPGGTVVLAATAAQPAAPAIPRPAPAGDAYRDALADAYKSFKKLAEGKNADYIPILASVDPALYGIVLVTVDGAVYEIGAARDEFSIQSVSKPFTAARAIETNGADAVDTRIGVNATGQKFNSILAIDLAKNMPADKDHIHPAGNPLVNAGAIAAVDMVAAAPGMDRWSVILGNIEAFAGRKLTVNEEVYRSEAETNTHNRAIVQLLKDYEVIQGDPMQALDLYTRQCSVSVSARDLAVMGATLANGGRNPLTRVQVVSPDTASKVLAIISTAGLYETTGEWLYRVGVPAKSGVGGGIVAVVPGRFAVGTFSPPLDPAGNSVRGQRAIGAIIKRLGGNVFASKPAGHARQTSASTTPTHAPAGGATVAGDQP